MSLNKVKPGSNMYPFITDTWNPIGGKCDFDCKYCSTNKFIYPHLKEKYSGPPKLIEKYLADDLGRGKYIFVVAQNDLFSRQVPDKWIMQVLLHCKQFPGNKYLFQTKNPDRFSEFLCFMPAYSAICTTIESNRHYPEISKAPSPEARANAMRLIPFVNKYVTIEPIMEFDLVEMIYLIQVCNPVMINIGANSGKFKIPEPAGEKVELLIRELEKFTTVNRKSNLSRLLK